MEEGCVVLRFVVEVEKLIDKEQALVDRIHVGVHGQENPLEHAFIIYYLQ